MTVLTPPLPVGLAVISPLALAVASDIALAATIGSHLGAGLRATATISLHHRLGPAPVPLRAVGTVTAASEGQALAACRLEANGEMLGQAHGWFAPAAITPDGQLPPPRWARTSLPEVTVPSVDELDETEAEVLRRVLAAAARAARNGTSLYDELLTFQSSQKDAAGVWTGTIVAGPELANRTGYVQGGCLYAIAAEAASRVVGLEQMSLTEGYYQFLRPGVLGPIQVTARPLREGRTRAFIEVELESGGKGLGAGLFSFA